MIISSNYSANQIFQMPTTQRNTRCFGEPALSSDKVTISDDAWDAYRKSKASAQMITDFGNKDYETQLAGEEKEFESTLTSWFNQVNLGSAPRKELLPENKELIDELETNIGKILEEDDVPGNFISQETYGKLRPLWLQGYAIQAFGDKMVVTDEVMEKAIPILDKLQTELESKTLGDGSLFSEFHNAVYEKSTSNSEEKVRKVKDDALEHILETFS